ncbi:hypothetical protein TARUN_5294 [Trichoderma arundinaceum]|uniref:Uncharacterized protein n=1 Tax=Trichoderma arundinaceum TaxID=490622 RepID=A0A395NLK6_TRIAR|nr:hypothetical protein TARUN_5294 [Trichoderma arundinaceum]
MWDVVWTDPDKELVGEHRARKEKEETLKKDHRSQLRRRSASTASSRWSTDSPFAIFRARASRKANISSSNAQMESSASSRVESPVMGSSDRSPKSKMVGDGSCRSSNRISTSFLERLTSIESPLNTSPLIPEKASDVGGKLLLRLASDDTSSLMPPAERVSIAAVPSDDLTESEKMKSLMQIFGRSPSTAEPADGCPLPLKESAVAPDSSNRPPTPPLPSEKKSVAAEPTLPPTPSSSPAANLKPGSAAVSIAQINPLLRTTDTSTEMPITPNNPEAWRAVGDWDSDSPPPLLRGSPEPTFDQPLDLDSSHDGIGIHKNFRLLQAAVVKMANTSASGILSRLETLWKDVVKKDVSFLLGDSSGVEELRRWMLSTMIHMDQVPALDGRVAPVRISPLMARMVVCLYDSPATVAYLAALEPTIQYYHLSQLSIPNEELYANVRIIPVSKPSGTDFPVAPRIYQSVHSLTLPSLCPSSQLARILNKVHKCLKKKGFLRLILIDPLPRAGTMGRRMKSWIEENLLRNLASQDKCMSPSTVFPPLLAEAHLRGEGSTLTTTKFYAVPNSVTSQDPDSTKDTAQAENEAKAKVRSLVGRVLWVEVWGPYVTCSKWWWDDPACVAECLELGTFWEYHAVKGVKEVKPA